MLYGLLAKLIHCTTIANLMIIPAPVLYRSVSRQSLISNQQAGWYQSLQFLWKHMECFLFYFSAHCHKSHSEYLMQTFELVILILFLITIYPEYEMNFGKFYS